MKYATAFACLMVQNFSSEWASPLGTDALSIKQLLRRAQAAQATITIDDILSNGILDGREIDQIKKDLKSFGPSALKKMPGSEGFVEKDAMISAIVDHYYSRHVRKSRAGDDAPEQDSAQQDQVFKLGSTVVVNSNNHATNMKTPYDGKIGVIVEHDQHKHKLYSAQPYIQRKLYSVKFPEYDEPQVLHRDYLTLVSKSNSNV